MCSGLIEGELDLIDGLIAILQESQLLLREGDVIVADAQSHRVSLSVLDLSLHTLVVILQGLDLRAGENDLKGGEGGT